MPEILKNSISRTVMKWGGISSGLMAIFALIGFLGFVPVFAGEFNEFKGQYFSDELDEAQDELRDIKIDIWRQEQQGEQIPPFLKEKQLELEDDIGEIEKELEAVK